jgi:hypothetical protein
LLNLVERQFSVAIIGAVVIIARIERNLTAAQ